MEKIKVERRRGSEFDRVTYTIEVKTKDRLSRYLKKFPSVNKSELVDQLINRHLDNLKIK